MDNPFVRMGILYAILALALWICGLVALLAEEWAWKVVKLLNDLHGQKSERTKAWEYGRIIFGIVALVAGVVLLSMAVTTASRPWPPIQR